MSEDPPEADIPEVNAAKLFNEAPRVLGPPNEDDYKEASKYTADEDMRWKIADMNYQARAGAGALAVTSAEKQKTAEELEDSRIDEKTGALTAKAFMNEAQEKLRVIESEQRSGRPNAAIIIQIDVKNLKKKNDIEGHEAGDELLKNVADLLRDSVRIEDGDIVGRLGGDEFALAVYFNSHEIAPEQMQAKLYERIKTRLYEEIAAGNITGLKFNGSIAGNGKTLKELLHDADTSDEVHGDRVQHIPSREEMPSRDDLDRVA